MSFKKDPKTDQLETQPAGEGSGPLYHRRYFTEFNGNGKNAAEVLEAVKTDPNRFSPKLMATFEKTRGEEKRLTVGDQFMVNITGPWNGPVEVSDIEPTSFTLKTLEGHMEAGRIRFTATDVGESSILFEIESWARSHTPLVDFLYDKIPLARAAQSKMWVSFCRAIAKDVLPEDVPLPEVQTETVKWNGQTWVKV